MRRYFERKPLSGRTEQALLNMQTGSRWHFWFFTRSWDTTRTHNIVQCTSLCDHSDHMCSCVVIVGHMMWGHYVHVLLVYATSSLSSCRIQCIEFVASTLQQVYLVRVDSFRFAVTAPQHSCPIQPRWAIPLAYIGSNLEGTLVME